MYECAKNKWCFFEQLEVAWSQGQGFEIRLVPKITVRLTLGHRDLGKIERFKVKTTKMSFKSDFQVL